MKIILLAACGFGALVQHFWHSSSSGKVSQSPGRAVDLQSWAAVPPGAVSMERKDPGGLEPVTAWRPGVLSDAEKAAALQTAIHGVGLSRYLALARVLPACNAQDL